MLKQYLVNYDMSVREAVKYVDIENEKIICVVDEYKKLLGIFTAGDMRRYVISGGDMSCKIGDVMNRNPKVFLDEQAALKEAEKKPLVAYPIVTKEGILRKIIFGDRKDETESKVLENVPLVMMAGGKGTRLYPYTKVLPKALIPIGDLTISERIINNFSKYGCKKVWFVLNYRAKMIQAYYSDLERNYEVDYAEEASFLGTGGGLRLLKEHLKSTFIVTNCDILVNADFEYAYRTHVQNHNDMTFVCAMKDMEVPYGVLQVDNGGNITDIVEKPSFSFLTNTGVYIIEPQVLDLIKDKEFIHLPEIAIRCIENGGKVGAFPVSNKAWLDMGQFSEMDKMIKELSR